AVQIDLQGALAPSRERRRLVERAIGEGEMFDRLPLAGGQRGHCLADEAGAVLPLDRFGSGVLAAGVIFVGVRVMDLASTLATRQAGGVDGPAAGDGAQPGQEGT